MFLSAKGPLGAKVEIIDFMGKKIPFVKTFDTETKEAEIFMTDSKGKIIVVQKDDSTIGTPLLIKVKLIGCKAINRKTGEEIK